MRSNAVKSPHLGALRLLARLLPVIAAIGLLAACGGSTEDMVSPDSETSLPDAPTAGTDPSADVGEAGADSEASGTDAGAGLPITPNADASADASNPTPVGNDPDAGAQADTASRPAVIAVDSGAPAGVIGVDAGAAPGVDAGSVAACFQAEMSSWAGSPRLLVGATTSAALAAQHGLDIRLQYIAGGLSPGAAPCTRCDSSCGNWWGCWQGSGSPPGQFARSYLAENEAGGQLTLFSYYQLLHGSGLSEGANQLAALNDSAFMRRYFADWRYLLQTIGQKKVLLHVEPDLWGYAQQQAAAPNDLAVQVQSANAEDCGALADNFAGFGDCMVRMVRKYAPNARVGMHVSAWATSMDAMQNRTASRAAVLSSAETTTRFVMASGGSGADFLTVEASDRDHGYYASLGQSRAWDERNVTLPHFEQAFAWAQRVAEAARKPLLWWQLPLGNESLPDTGGAWKDNRVDYFFAHLPEVLGTHAFGAVFSSGATGQTTPSSDQGNFFAKSDAYLAGSGVRFCPSSQ